MEGKTLLVLTTLLLIGCATTPRVTNLRPAALCSEPPVPSYLDPSTKAATYRTFSVSPSSALWQETELGGGVVEKQMLLFALRNAVEEIGGYRFVALDKSPDLLVTVSTIICSNLITGTVSWYRSLFRHEWIGHIPYSRRAFRKRSATRHE